MLPQLSNPSNILLSSQKEDQQSLLVPLLPTPKIHSTFWCLWIYISQKFYLSNTIYRHLCLASFTEYISKIPSCRSMSQRLLSFYGCVIFHCMDLPHFVYPFNLMDTWAIPALGTIRNKAAVNIRVLCAHAFLLFARGRTRESSVSSVCNHLKSHERASQCGCPASHSLWQDTRVPMAPHLHCHCLAGF